MDLVANNAYKNYYKNKNAMQHHARKIAASKLYQQIQDIKAYSPHFRKIQVKGRERARSRKRTKVLAIEKKHQDAFAEASTSAWKNFETNRRIHQTVKGIRQAENFPKKALQLVANTAAENYSKYLRGCRLHGCQYAAAHRALLINNTKDIVGRRARFSAPRKFREEDSNWHLQQGSKAHRESYNNWFVNRRLYATIKGVNRLQFAWADRRADKNNRE
ncbi:hypothetical protein MMC10_007997 [Thelotrema lepadinum]|nr:hypothetical protein [Thelotrema lepadinum]